jgi:ubiquinone biosynthesis monooxygenase Coq7
MDALINAADMALRTLFAPARASRPFPVGPVSGDSLPNLPTVGLTAEEKALSASLMRVNHVGEVCAQALYTAQALATKNGALRDHFMRASAEETDHLAWTKQRLDELGSRPSLLNPLWYAGAFGLGLLAGRFGDRVSLGFVVETERQVESHLEGHLQRLPAGDTSSRAVVTQMKSDEVRHALDAHNAGAVDLPAPVKGLMKVAARVMTTTAHYV